MHLQQFFRISSLPPYLLGDVAKMVREARLQGKDIVDLSQVNPSLELPQLAMDKLVQSCLQPHNYRYSSSQGIARLRRAISCWYAENFGIEIDSEQEVICCMGSKEGLTHLLLSVLSPGDTVLVPIPAYPIHTSSVFLAGASFIGIPMFEDHQSGLNCNYRLDHTSEYFFQKIEEAFYRTWPIIQQQQLLLLNFGKDLLI
jgi:alanine-synthesizing transaminase